MDGLSSRSSCSHHTKPDALYPSKSNHHLNYQLPHTHTHLPPPPAAIGLTSDDFRNILITSVGELPALFVALAGMELLGRRTTITLALGSTALATLALTTHPTGATFSALMFAGRWGGGWAARGGGLQPYYVVWTYCLHA